MRVNTRTAEPVLFYMQAGSQITTYLRPMGSTVPQIYGPSRDEP